MLLMFILMHYLYYRWFDNRDDDDTQVTIEYIQTPIID
jgi:hypothetical protein